MAELAVIARQSAADHGTGPAKAEHSLPGHARAALRSTSGPLPDIVRDRMGRAFDHDFSRVQLHNTPAAETSTRALGTSAYTFAEHLVWGLPDIPPGSPGSRLLLGHELAHVIQQAPGGARHQIACAPRSLNKSLNPALLTFTELTGELEEIKTYLAEQRASSTATDAMALEEVGLRKELARRQELERKPKARKAGTATRGRAAPNEPRSLFTSLQVDGKLPEAELNDELDAIHARLQQGASGRDRKTLQTALQALESERHRRRQAGAEQARAGKIQKAFAPSITAKDGDALAEVMRAVDSMTPSSDGRGTWTLYRNGEYVELTADEHQKMLAQVESILAAAIRRIRSKTVEAEDRYGAQMRINKDQWVVSGVVHFFGGIDDPGPSIARNVMLARTFADTLEKILPLKKYAQAAELLVASEKLAVIANKASYQYVEDLISTAETTVTVLEVTRDVAFATALALGAVVAAPLVVAAGSGLGLTGAGAAAFNIVGTGVAVAGEGAALRGGSAGGGVLLAGGSARNAWNATKREGKQGAIEGFATGIGGGVAAELGTALKVGQQTTRLAAVARGAVAQGGGNAAGSGVGTALGGGSIRDVAKSTAIGFGVGVVSAPISAASGSLENRALARLADTGVAAGIGGGQTYLETGDRAAAFRSAAVSGASALAMTAHTAPVPKGPSAGDAAAPPKSLPEAAIAADSPSIPVPEPTPVAAHEIAAVPQSKTEPVAVAVPEPAALPPSADFGESGNGRRPAKPTLPDELHFKGDGPMVQVPVSETGAPAKVLEMGAGPLDTNLGLPPDPRQGNLAVPDASLVELTRTDAVQREGVARHDATAVPGAGLRNQESLLINNPRGYDVDIATVGESLKPGGRMVVQGLAEVVPGMRGTNGNMNRLLRAVERGEMPPGYRVVEVVKLPDAPRGAPTPANRPPDVMGGPFNKATGEPVGWPNTRITIEKLPLPQSPTGTVTVNIGGTGAPHEPRHAVNLNPQVPGTERKGIPNHLNAPGEDIAKQFARGSVDEVVGHNLPPHVLDWSKVAPGAFEVLTPGGRFEIYFRGGNTDAQVCAAALHKAGFENVKVLSDTLVSANKPASVGAAP